MRHLAGGRALEGRPTLRHPGPRGAAARAVDARRGPRGGRTSAAAATARPAAPRWRREPAAASRLPHRGPVAIGSEGARALREPQPGERPGVLFRWKLGQDVVRRGAPAAGRRSRATACWPGPCRRRRGGPAGVDDRATGAQGGRLLAASDGARGDLAWTGDSRRLIAVVRAAGRGARSPSSSTATAPPHLRCAAASCRAPQPGRRAGDRRPARRTARPSFAPSTARDGRTEWSTRERRRGRHVGAERQPAAAGRPPQVAVRGARHRRRAPAARPPRRRADVVLPPIRCSAS